MKTIIDRKDMQDRVKVTLYDKVLRYNEKCMQQPVRVAMVNSYGKAPGETVGLAVTAGPVAAKGGVEVKILESVPNSTKKKGQLLVEKLKVDPVIAWTHRWGVLTQQRRSNIE